MLAVEWVAALVVEQVDDWAAVSVVDWVVVLAVA